MTTKANRDELFPVVAINHRAGSFSSGWIRYCEDNGIHYRIVDAFAADIWEKLAGCGVFLWHWTHLDNASKMFARSILTAVESRGLVVFPDHATGWHFDDKVAQKYLLEAIAAPLVPSYCFFSRCEAIKWLESAKFPLVSKLRNGAGASNVALVPDRTRALSLIKRSFGAGHLPVARGYHLSEAFRLLRQELSARSLKKLIAGILNLAFPSFIARGLQREYGYVYFQEFAAGNDFDIRVVVIGEKAIAIKRLVRQGDFRASGSGRIIYDPKEIPLPCIEIAFRTAQTLDAQCIAFDFVITKRGWEIVEISYGFTESAYLSCPGYWLSTMEWVPAQVSPSAWIIENALSRWRVRNGGDERGRIA